jgi:hypothetical protein
MPKAVTVTADNFIRAESDMYFSAIVKKNGFGKFEHNRAPVDIENQTVVRLNRDTLYSGAVFDLDAGPVTVSLPDAGQRFISLQVIDEDEYVHDVVYAAGPHTYSREEIGTRYVIMAIRILANPADPGDLREVAALQDAVRVLQKEPGHFEVPTWDQQSQRKVRQALLALAETVPDTKSMFGSRDQVDPVRHLIGAASAWGGNPEKDALYLNVVPGMNDGKTIYRLVVKDVPVDGFWSVSVYNSDGYFTPNSLNVYSLNNLTAKKAGDGTITIQFGGCNDKSPNCLPIMPGWNYMVRLYRPRTVILSGKWKFPEAQPVH